MEALIVVAVIALVIGAVIWRNKRSASGSAGDVSPIDPFPPVQAKQADSGSVSIKLPAASKLKVLTKKQLVAMAEENGIQLNDKKTKDEMIADLRSSLKAK
jgi:hypothetical protein